MNEAQYAASDERSFQSHAEFYQNSAYAEFQQQHRASGSLGLRMMRVEQEPFDLIDAAVPEIVFLFAHHGGQEAGFDLGDGFKRWHNFPANGLSVVPPNTELRGYVTCAQTVTVATLPIVAWKPIQDEVGVGDHAFSEYYHGSFNYDLRVVRLIQQMWTASANRHQTDSLLLDGLSLQFLALLSSERELLPVATDTPDDPRIDRVIDYIAAHIGEALTVTELATVACLSPGHFSRTFKATTGEAVWSYVQRRRCERARDMLLATKKPIAQIAFDCGFANQAHLTRQLSARFGATPGAIRRESQR